MKGIGADGPYWEGLAEGRLVLPRCQACGRWAWPAVFRCSGCGSWSHEWLEQPMLGSIFTWTRTWHDFGAPACFEPPFVSVVVTMQGDSGVRLLGTMAAGAEPQISDPVRGRAITVEFSGRKLPAIQWEAYDE